MPATKQGSVWAAVLSYGFTLDIHVKVIRYDVIDNDSIRTDIAEGDIYLLPLNHDSNRRQILKSTQQFTV